MIKIDWKRLGQQYQIFGWQYVYVYDGSAMDFTRGKEWLYSPYWVDRLWPLLHNNKELPLWWYKILGWQRL